MKTSAQFTIGLGVLAVLARLSLGQTAAPPTEAGTFESQCLKYVIGTDGRNLHFIDKRNGTDYLDSTLPSPVAVARVAGKEIAASSAKVESNKLLLGFGDSAKAVLEVTPTKRHLVVAVVSLDGEGVEDFTFVNIPLKLKGNLDEPFAGCVLARNLKTNVNEIPQAMSRLRAMCYKRFGFTGAQAAVIGCPTADLRDVLKEAVLAAPELPQSKLGGPWALESRDNRGSYLFNLDNMTEKNVDEWVALAKAAGFSQIDFHGGVSFRFGDCLPSPKLYPNGRASFKAVIDKLHAAGIKAGLHTYAFFIDQKCPWVTPVPDPRLGKDATFTLVGDLPIDVVSVPVAETTEKMSNVADFFIQNSVTLQIDDELIIYKQIDKKPPYAFTQCQRGAWGTKAAAHKAGAKVHHLKQCFGLFTPDGDSTLLTEVAAATAEMYNECGFDMIYLDALDGEGILGGGENGWHYGSKFTYEIAKRLNKPAIMEMSTFHHHLWLVRSRLGAWDHPNRGYKRYVDIHAGGNAGYDRQFLPGHLGWWAVKSWTGHQDEPTFVEDNEYLLCKCMGHDVGFSVVTGLTPESFKSNPFFQRMAGMMRQYEELRHGRYFDDVTLAALREPVKEFRLVKGDDGGWQFRPVVCAKQKIYGVKDPSAEWKVENPFEAQTPRLRIEALHSTEAYAWPKTKLLTDFADLNKYTTRQNAPGVTFKMEVSTEQVNAGGLSAKLTATNSSDKANGAWACIGRVYEPTLNMKGHEAIGVWVHGDGGGAVLNFVWRSPPELLHRGQGEHLVTVDFKGWRYFELVELDGALHDNYAWPFGGGYDVYRENVDEGNLKTFDIWCNNLPPGKQTEIFISPIRGLGLIKAKFKNPSIEISGKKLTFPIEMETGSYLEYNSPTDCTLYSAEGKELAKVTPQGEAGTLADSKNMKGTSITNELRFTCESPPIFRPRARVTVFCEGKPMGAKR